MVEGDGSELSYVLATVSKTTAAGVGHLIAADRTFVAGDLDDLDHVRVVLVSAHSELHALSEDSALLVYAAPGGRLLARRDRLRNIENVLEKLVAPGESRDLSQDLVF